MNDWVRDLLITSGLLPTLLELALPLVVSPLVAWISYRWSKLTKQKMEKDDRDRLHLAFSNAGKIGIRRATQAGLFGRAGDDYALTEAASYVEEMNPGAVKRFGLSRDRLKRMAEAYLPPR